MIAEEANVLAALNKQRDDPAGATCQRRTPDPNTGNIRVIQGFFPRSSPVVPNEAFRCAARLQAKNIVDETIERGSFPPNLHHACPSRGDAICEKFSTRMDSAGYEFFQMGLVSPTRLPQLVIDQRKTLLQDERAVQAAIARQF